VSTFVQPDSLNSLQRFMQARRALTATTRASHPGWYLDATELHHQVHLRVDGESLTGWSYLRKTNTWTFLGEVSPQILVNGSEERAEFIAKTLENQRGQGATCLGVVLHVGDEFAITEINPEAINPDELPDLRETIIYDPASVLDDSTLIGQEISCRLFPLPANQATGSFAAAVTHSTRHSGLLSAFRQAGEEENFPVRTMGLSAPLLALCALPFLLVEPIQKPFLAVFHYPLFTILAFFSRHGELAGLRSLPHHGQRRSGNLRQAATAAAAVLEMADPNICVVPMASFSCDAVVADLKQAFPLSPVEMLPWRESAAIIQRGNLPLECLAASEALAAANSPLSNNETFSILSGDGWAQQDFLPPTLEESNLFPTRRSMLLVRASRPFHALCALCIIGLSAWIGFDFIQAVQEQEWWVDAAEAKKMDQKKAALIEEGSQLSRWDQLLEDRSKAWANMELISRMFPADSGILLRSCDHSAELEPSGGKSTAGFIKNWTLVGFAKTEAQARLTELNTHEGITKVFSEVAEVTGNSAFAPEASSRSLIVSISKVENRRFKPPVAGASTPADETSYPLSFTLNLSQRFDASDPLALPVSAPKKKPRAARKTS